MYIFGDEDPKKQGSLCISYFSVAALVEEGQMYMDAMTSLRCRYQQQSRERT